VYQKRQLLHTDMKVRKLQMYYVFLINNLGTTLTEWIGSKMYPFY
jgi:hypothetical protein